MPKLQKQLSRKVGDKEYLKYVVVIPPEIIKKVGFKEGQELNIKESNSKIILSANE